jgi:hypothetical protein
VVRVCRNEDERAVRRSSEISEGVAEQSGAQPATAVGTERQQVRRPGSLRERQPRITAEPHDVDDGIAWNVHERFADRPRALPAHGLVVGPHRPAKNAVARAARVADGEDDEPARLAQGERGERCTAMFISRPAPGARIA